MTARKTMRPHNPFWLALLPIAACLSDVGLTLHGQPAGYWRGDYHDVNEANPLPRIFLEWHPLAFAILVLVWVACFTAVILFVSRWWAVGACLAVIVGHTLGALSWLVRGRPFGVWFAGLFLFTVVVLALPTVRAWRGGEAPTRGRRGE